MVAEEEEERREVSDDLGWSTSGVRKDTLNLDVNHFPKEFLNYLGSYQGKIV